jgi:23S rRNA (guanosine2251-2'-O)-methyltransferase
VKARLPFERKQHNRENKRLRRMGGTVYRRKTPPKDSGDIVEGRNPVIEALRAGRTIKRILLANGVGQSAAVEKIFRLARERGMTVERVERREVERLSVTGKSQGVLAMAGPKGYVGLKRLLEIGPQRGEATLLVVLDGIQDPHNLGAIIRTAEAAGVHGIVIPEHRSASLSAGVARASAGAMEHMAVARVPNLVNVLERLKKQSVWTVGVDPKGTADFTELDYQQPTALVVGAEGKGLSRLIKERCDALARIPMRGRIASLNASVSAALVMYESMRQRRGVGASGRNKPTGRS